MAQPTSYSRQFSFTGWSTLYPTTPQPGVQLDNEFTNIKVTLDQTLANLKLIQRDDGAIQNGIIGPDQLSTALVTGITAATPWTTSTAYAVNNIVSVTSTAIYRCLVAHTSGTFATDLAAGKWVLLLDITTPLATTGTFVSGTFTGNGVQTAYNLGYTINNAERVIWTENGVVKTPGVDYTISGTTLTRLAAPGNGVAISWRLLGSSVSYAFGTASITGSMLANGTITATQLAAGSVGTTQIAANAVTMAKIATQADKTLLANISGGVSVPAASALSAILDAIIGSAGGLILYRDPTNGWSGLTAGAAGSVLTGQGVGSAPAFVTPSTAASSIPPFASFNLR